MSEISDNDVWLLSYYRESELAGSLVMGRLAQQTDDDALRANLTEHCAEEARHAWMWSETIRRLGHLPRRVRETYQTRYYQRLGAPRTMLEILALTQVFERRVVRHFRAHLAWPGTHPVVAETLRAMIVDEAGHISWVRHWLDGYAITHGSTIVEDTLRRYEVADREIYAELSALRDRFAAVADPARGGRDGATDSDVLAVVAATLDVPPAALTPDTSLASLASLGVDSLDLVLLVMELEDRFQVELEPGELRRLATLAELTARVNATPVSDRATVAG
ncbi:hypothetical protein BH23GEM2_BH23GEM2_02040 [soil metagenome]